MISLERGFIFTSMIFGAIGVALIERKFRRAAAWTLAAALLSSFGIIHAYDITPGGIASRFGFMAAAEFALAYLILAALFVAVASAGRGQEDG
jgi:AGZA family xanthine/uracil permease-like MFS transporter